MGPRVNARIKRWGNEQLPQIPGVTYAKAEQLTVVFFYVQSLPWWVNPLLNRGFHSQSHRCRNALAVTSLAATSSGFSNNETSPRTWSTGLDLIWCIKIDLWRHRGQLMNSLLLLFGRWEWQMTFPAEKSGGKILSASRDKRSFFSPQDSFWEGQFSFPSKISILEDWRYIYPCTKHLLLSSFDYQSLSVTRQKGYICSLSNNGILDCCEIKIHWRYLNKSQH